MLTWKRLVNDLACNRNNPLHFFGILRNLGKIINCRKRFQPLHVAHKTKIMFTQKLNIFLKWHISQYPSKIAAVMPQTRERAKLIWLYLMVVTEQICRHMMKRFKGVDDGIKKELHLMLLRRLTVLESTGYINKRNINSTMRRCRI